ncbi:putative ADP-ribosylation factor GTPase-activating protein AGD5 [Vitis vinifera]|uniref:Putative ADP-ribosylation factor GTPase-activating protein AGD5 n=1 Tax=Vitis vinifera TaxID=29760 RepID=A0A438I8S8_VITVI|nr:putative ADP-ribosylation factor GTPase-activating protein AGD5 [Vitis vinifera]
MVRSATLDTWLPEQVAFIQSMGNEKANSYWEAELPPNYDRVGIENFIRAKYEDKRWIPKDGKPRSTSQGREEKASARWHRPGDRGGSGNTSNSENSFEEKKNVQAPSIKDNGPATRISLPVPPKGPEPVAPIPKPHQVTQKPEPSVPQAESAKQAADSTPVVPPLKLIMLLIFLTCFLWMILLKMAQRQPLLMIMHGLVSSVSAEQTSTAEKTAPAKPIEGNTQSTSGIEDLFKDSPSIMPAASDKPQKDVKNDIMSLFEKSNMVSPFSLHQQQLAMLAQQQSLLMAAAAKSTGVAPKFSINAQQHSSNGTDLPTQNWPNMGYQIPGMMMQAAGNNDMQKFMQAANMGPTHPAGNSVPFATSRYITYYFISYQLILPFLHRSMYTMGQVAPTNGVATTSVSRPPSASPATPPTQPGKEYDFSSLTQGMFSKP